MNMSLKGGIVDIKIHKTLSRILVYQDYLLRKLLSLCDFPSGFHPNIMAGDLFQENILRTLTA
jgi:hypothetical protein